MASNEFFEPGCPYNRPGLVDPMHGIPPPMFRLKRTCKHGKTFTADSLGDHHYIDPASSRGCSDNCYCRVTSIAPEELTFAFVVVQTPESIQVRFLAQNLCDVVIKVAKSPWPFTSKEDRQYWTNFSDTCSNTNGQNLLGIRECLLKELENRHRHYPCPKAPEQLLQAQLTLLNYGLLHDPEIFELPALRAAMSPMNFLLPEWGSEISSSAHGQLTFTRSSPPHCDWECTSRPRITKITGNCCTLARAARDGRLGCIRSLLAAGLDPLNLCTRCITGRTALSYAICGSHKEIARVLYRAGARMNATALVMSESRDLWAAIHYSFFNPEQNACIHAKKFLDEGHGIEALLSLLPWVPVPDKKLVAVLATRASVDDIQAALPESRRFSDKFVAEVEDYMSTNAQLIRAVGLGHFNKTRQLLDIGADPTWALETALCQKNMALISLLYQRGAEDIFVHTPNVVTTIGRAAWVQLLSAALRMGVRNRLAEQPLDHWRSYRGTGSMPKWDLIGSKSRATHTAFAAMLAASNAVKRRKPGLKSIANLENLEHDDTALMEAVQSGQIDRVRLLLQHGANINIMAAGKTALSIAARAGADSMMRILLEHGADSHVAILVLQSESSTTPRAVVSRAINRLSAISKEIFNKQSVWRVQQQFAREHIHMRSRAKQSLDFRSLGYEDWKSRLEKDTRKAWRIGLEALQSLCNKIMLRSVTELLPFLALARSMSFVTDRENLRDSLSEFNQDLGRWQLLFSDTSNTHNAEVTDFIYAALEIWKVNITKSTRDSLYLSGDMFERFQRLALSLAARVNGLFDSPDWEYIDRPTNEGIWQESEQQAKTGETMPPEVTPMPEIDIPPDEMRYFDLAVDPDGLQDHHGQTVAPYDFGQPALPRSPGLEAAPDGLPFRWPRHSRYPENTDLIIVILMAGAIFAMVISFLSCLGGEMLFDCFGTVENQMQSLRKHSLGVLLGAVVRLASTTVADKQPGLLQQISGFASSAINSGKVASLSKLQNFLREDYRCQPPTVGVTLAAMLDKMKYLDRLQHSYTVISEFLGVKPEDITVSRVNPLQDDSIDASERASPRDTDSTTSSRKRSYSQGATDVHPYKQTKTISETSWSSPAQTTTTQTPVTSIDTPRTSEKKTYCDECKRDLKTTSNYGKHRRSSIHDNKTYTCPVAGCGKVFHRPDTLKKHGKIHRRLVPNLPPRLS